MVRRSKKKTTRRSRQKGVSILGVAETYMLASVATNTLFNMNAIEFVMGAPGAPSWGTGSGYNKIGLKELFSTTQYQGNNKMGGIGSQRPTLDLIKENLNENWGKGIAGMILIPLGFRVGKQIARPAISRTNRLLGKAGIANTVKV
jgi:hypothetical protein